IDDVDGNDLVVEPAFLLRLERAPIRSDRELILRFAADLEALRAKLGRVAHVEVVVRIPQAVVDHAVDETPMAEPISRTRALEEVGRVRHALHAARDDDVRVAQANRLRCEHYRLEARSAHLVDRRAWHASRDSSAERRLPRGRLPYARGEHLAEDHLIDLGALEIG